MASFPLLFLGNIGQKNAFYDIIQQKNFFLCYKNEKFKKSKNWNFSKGVNPSFWSKHGHFSNFFSLGNIGQKNVFCDILERKNDFLDYKDKKLKKSKNSHFFKGVNPSLWSKHGHFSNFFSLGNIGQENVFYDILEGKNASLGYEKRKFKKSKNSHFSHGFGPIMVIFLTLFFLGNIGHEHVFYDILEGKNAFLGYKTKKFKKSKKGLTHGFGTKTGIFLTFF